MFSAVSGMSSGTTISSNRAPVSSSASHPRRDHEEYFLLPTTIFSMAHILLFRRRTAEARTRGVRPRQLLVEELALHAQIFQVLRYAPRPLVGGGERLDARPHRAGLRAQRRPLAALAVDHRLQLGGARFGAAFLLLDLLQLRPRLAQLHPHRVQLFPEVL